MENYCGNCGHRLHPNDSFCPNCNFKTRNEVINDVILFEPPIHNIGFFNFQIDFSPYIDPKNNVKYEICSCGYLNDINNEFCYMCGAKRHQSKLEKLIRNKQKPVFSLDNVLCDCGAINSRENVFCERCGKQLKEDNSVSFDIPYT